MAKSVLSASVSDDPFAQPQKLLIWAHNAHGAAKRAWEEFILGTEHRLVTEEDPKTKVKIQKVVLSGTMPNTIEENATNTINNLRNAFDQMLFAACRAIRKPIKDGHYPWATTPADLGQKFVNKKTGKERIPSEFWDLIRSQEPYPAADTHEGGNTLIRAVAALANTKHTVGLEILATAHVNLASVTIRGPATGIFTGLPIPRAPIPYKDGVEITRWYGDGGPEPGYEYRLDMNVGFNESAPSELRHIPALNALVDFGIHAQSCLAGFKRRVAELGF